MIYIFWICPKIDKLICFWHAWASVYWDCNMFPYVSEELSIYCLFWRVGIAWWCMIMVEQVLGEAERTKRNLTEAANSRYFHVEDWIPLGSLQYCSSRWQTLTIWLLWQIMSTGTSVHWLSAVCFASSSSVQGRICLGCGQRGGPSCFHLQTHRLSPNLVPFTGGFSETRNIRTRMVHLGQPWSLWSKDFLLGLRWLYGALWRNLHIWNCCYLDVIGMKTIPQIRRSACGCSHTRAGCGNIDVLDWCI